MKLKILYFDQKIMTLDFIASLTNLGRLRLLNAWIVSIDIFPVTFT